MSTIESRLQSLGLSLGAAKPAVGLYLGSKRAGDLLFVSGRKSALTGRVGRDVTEEEAKKAARNTALLILAIVKADIGELDKIEGIVKMQGFINADPSFHRLPQVLDGASELLIALFGEQGRHARTATGAAQLPYEATIQLDMILKLKP